MPGGFNPLFEKASSAPLGWVRVRRPSPILFKDNALVKIGQAPRWDLDLAI